MTERSHDAEVRVVLTTAPSLKVAEEVASALVEERLAACANLLPGAISIFRWAGDVQREGEVIVLLKTTVDRLQALRERLLQIHPYDVPEMLALPVEVGHDAYLAWVRAEVAAT